MKLQRQFKAEQQDGQPPETPTQKQEIKPEQIFEHLGFKAENIKTLDDFKTELNQNFIRRDQEIIRGDSDLYGKLIGAKSKGTMTAAARALRENGIPYTDDDLKEPKLETFVENMITRAAKSSAEKIKELEEKVAEASSKNSDEKLTKLQAKLQAEIDAKNKELQETAAKLSSAENEWQTKLQQKESEIKSLALKTEDERTFAKAKWASSAKPLEIKGFISSLKEEVEFAFDEQGKYRPFKDGKLIPNPAVKDTFYDAEEFIKERAIKANLWAINPHGKGNAQSERKREPVQQQEGQPIKFNTVRPNVRVQPR